MPLRSCPKKKAKPQWGRRCPHVDYITIPLSLPALFLVLRRIGVVLAHVSPVSRLYVALPDMLSLVSDTQTAFSDTPLGPRRPRCLSSPPPQLSVAQLTKDYDNLVGDVLVSAGMIAYSGPFTPDFRHKLVKGWQDKLLKLGVPHSEGCDARLTLADPVQVTKKRQEEERANRQMFLECACRIL